MNQQITLQGTGILPNSSSCYIHAENFKILPHSLGRATINLSNAHIILPNVANIIHSLEETVFQANEHRSVNLQNLDAIVERAASRGYTQGLDVSKVVTALRSRESSRPPSRNTWIFSVAIALIGIGIVWLIWSRSAKMSPFCGRQLKHAKGVSDQNVNKNDVVLQMESGRGKEEEEGMMDDSSRIQSQPTAFVQHGHLVTDCP